MGAADLSVTVALIVIWLAWVNYWTYEGFRQDKERSLQGEWRIPEYALLRWAGRGGAPAAYYARAKLRHKTRKEPFSPQLRWIAIQQAIWVPATIALIFWSNPVGWMREHQILQRTLDMLWDLLKAFGAMIA